MIFLIQMTFLTASAYDFEVDGIAYTITSLSDLTVSVDQMIDKDVTKIKIPELVEYKNKTLKVISIKDEAFKDNIKLTEISLPNSIVSIGSKAFMNDWYLEVVNTPLSLSFIGKEAFSHCHALSTFYIPPGIKQIEDDTFYYCIALKSIDLPTSLLSIGERAFCGSGLESISIPSNVTTLGIAAFWGTNLEEIHLHEGIETIPASCFSGCSKLRNIIIKSSSIGDWAFRDCTALQNISLPDNLISIGNHAFDGCINLLEFTIPSQVKIIEPSILWNCPCISKLTIGKNINKLPFNYDYDFSSKKTVYETMGGYKYSYADIGTYKSGTYLQGVKEFIIEDSENPLPIRGFITDSRLIPPFANTELNYYYVGRPLQNIRSWMIGVTEFNTNIEQGTGRIKKLEIGGTCTSVPYFYQQIDTLKLGEKILEIDLRNIYKEDLVQIECLAKNPPKFYDKYEFPTKVYTDAILYVPYGCKNAYSKAEIWKNFWNIYELSEESSGVNDTFEYEKSYSYDVYNIAGVLIGKSYNIDKIKNLPKGIYIIINKFEKCKIKI